MSKRLLPLVAVVNSGFTADEVYLEMSDRCRDFLRRTDIEAADVRFLRVDEDPFDDPEVVDDSKKVLSFTVHTILCRLGMTETEAHTAISEIHEAGIIFAKKES